MRYPGWGSLLAALAAVSAVAWSGDARACGGCFIQPVQGNDGGTIVTSHRMVLSISQDQTILWDQIQYTGSPAGFAWVLPVKPGARVDLASKALFDVLDAATGTQVGQPLLTCEVPGYFGCSVAPGVGAGTGFGCGASEADSGTDATPSDPVQVVSHGATGPYESAIIHSDVPGALPKWLEAHGYSIPAGISPVIDAYQKEGFDFAALRLLPSAGVQQMRPVRVVQKGASPVLPLRMVAAGTGPRTAITLFVIGEGRYTTKNIPEVTIPRDRVVWDYETASSSYASLRDLTYGNGRSFFTAYAEPGAFFEPIVNPITRSATLYQTTSGWQFDTAADAFVEQAFINGETSSTDCSEALDALAGDERKVIAPCDAGEPGCSYNPSTEIEGSNLECDPPIGSDIPLDDIAQALVGMHPQDVWITRLEANLSREALVDDLTLEPAAEQVPLPGAFVAGLGQNIPLKCKMAPKGAALAQGPSIDDNDPKSGGRFNGRSAPALFLGALGVLLALRRVAASRRARPAAPAAPTLGVAR